MDADREQIVGKWTVKFKSWIWEYTFGADGTVGWRDPLNQEKGEGGWSKAGKLINIWWTGSATKESWQCPIRSVDQPGWVAAPYGHGPATAQKVVAKPASQNQPGVPVNAEIANVPWERYIDQFSECKYDMNYKVPGDRSFAFSAILQLRYSDGAAIEVDIEKDFTDQSMTSEAARDAMARGRLRAGGRIFPAVLTARTVPRLWAARADAFQAQHENVDQFAQIAVAGVAFVLSVPAMPAGMVDETAVASTRVTRRRTSGVSRSAGALPKMKPLNGKVSVGGGFENRDGTNLNPINPNSGGPSRNIPNHVLGRMEDMDRVFEAGSVNNMISSKLRFGDVNWNQGTTAAAKVMAPGGRVSMNVWTQSSAEQEVLRTTFANAGFKNVRVVQVGMDGSSTMVMANF